MRALRFELIGGAGSAGAGAVLGSISHARLLANGCLQSSAGRFYCWSLSHDLFLVSILWLDHIRWQKIHHRRLTVWPMNRSIAIDIEMPIVKA
jgi:hypothetical protein